MFIVDLFILFLINFFFPKTESIPEIDPYTENAAAFFFGTQQEREREACKPIDKENFDEFPTNGTDW